MYHVRRVQGNMICAQLQVVKLKDQLQDVLQIDMRSCVNVYVYGTHLLAITAPCCIDPAPG